MWVITVSIRCCDRQYPRSIFHWTSRIGSDLPSWLGAKVADLKSLDLISPGLGRFIFCTEGALGA